MKLLIAYDGSKCAEAAIDDLARSGLPRKGSAEIISVAEVWLPPPEAIDDPAEKPSPYIEEILRTHREKGERALSEASMRTKHAEARVRNALPGWTVSSSATYGSPAWEILAAAQKFHAELIVVGSHGHSALSRLILGSISQKVLTEAECSVRVSRGRIEVDESPVRILIGFDGSAGSRAAVNAIACRCWRPGSQARLVTATELIAPSSITRFVPPVAKMIEEVNVTEEHWISHLAGTSIEKLSLAGLKVSHHIHPGNPKEILVDEAKGWGADSIFVGANAYGSGLGRSLVGSTSAAVAARAHCSVEIVRIPVATDAKTNG